MTPSVGIHLALGIRYSTTLAVTNDGQEKLHQLWLRDQYRKSMALVRALIILPSPAWGLQRKKKCLSNGQMIRELAWNDATAPRVIGPAFSSYH